MASKKCLHVTVRLASADTRRSYTISLDPRASQKVHQSVRKFTQPPQVETPEGATTDYILTSYSLWNFAAAGGRPMQVLQILRHASKIRLSTELESWVVQMMSRYGLIHFRPSSKATNQGYSLFRMDFDPELLKQAIAEDPRVEAFCYEEGGTGYWYIPNFLAGRLKHLLGWLGYPVIDELHRPRGLDLKFKLRRKTRLGEPFKLRPYQQEINRLYRQQDRLPGGTGGVFLGPPGIGKTIEGIVVAVNLQGHFLIVTATQGSVHQWRRELLDKTTLEPDDIGEYTSEKRQIRPVTITTYAMLAQGADIDRAELTRFEAALKQGKQGRQEVFRLGALIRGKLAHFDLLQTDASGRSRWRLIINDEVDRLPADHWRVAAQLEASYVLGMTSTAVREDGRIPDEPSNPIKGELFNLVGPVVHEVTFPEARRAGWVAPVHCYRVEVPLRGNDRQAYLRAEDRHEQRRIAWHNSAKFRTVQAILERHRGKPIVIIGHFLESLGAIAHRLGVPYLDGQTPDPERERVYGQFRRGDIQIMVVSSIADRAVDWPDAAVLIEINSHYGSRPQGGQRVGRIMRPKEAAYYYTLVTPNTPEENPDADKKQDYLTARGYTFQTIQTGGIAA